MIVNATYLLLLTLETSLFGYDLRTTQDNWRLYFAVEMTRISCMALFGFGGARDEMTSWYVGGYLSDAVWFNQASRCKIFIVNI